MGIPRKGSRRVEVGGKPFRYLVKETHIEDHKDQKELSVVVQEEAEKPGNVLRFRAGYGSAISALVVKKVVRAAQAQGWRPEARGTAYDFEAGL